LGGAFIGAKLTYLIAEGWLDIGKSDLWLRWATGKSVLGGYAGVELTKRLVGHRKSTGDAFVLIMPLSLLLGRVGCLMHGCCQGRVGTSGLRWPAPQVEAGFQVIMFITALVMNRVGLLRDRLFFLYLLSYGLFRFAHEFMRDTPKVWLGFSGYQGISLVMVVLGGWQLWRTRGAF